MEHSSGAESTAQAKENFITYSWKKYSGSEFTKVKTANIKQDPTAEDLERFLEAIKQSDIFLVGLECQTFKSESDVHKVLDVINEITSLKKVRLVGKIQEGPCLVHFIQGILHTAKIERFALVDPNGDFSQEDLKLICESLRGNKSITALTIDLQSEDSISTILDSIVLRGGIKELKLPFKFNRANSLQHVLHSSNEISRLQIGPQLASVTVGDLRAKTSLKCLKIKSNGQVNWEEDPFSEKIFVRGLDFDRVLVNYLPDPAFVASKVLSKNSTLHEFLLKNVEPRNNDGHITLISSLQENQTLKRLTVPVTDKIAAGMMFKAVKGHQSLNTLEIHCKRPHYMNDILEKTPEVLFENWSLRKITILGKEEYQVVTTRNKEAQNNFYHDTRMAVRILERGGMFEQLPIEIWCHIFEHLQHPGVFIDYLALFSNHRQG